MKQQNAPDLSFRAAPARQPSNKRYFWRHDLNAAVPFPFQTRARSLGSISCYLPFRPGVLTFSVIPRSVEPGLEEEEEASRSITRRAAREPEFHAIF